MEWHERDGVRWLAARLPGATAAFSTRVGGVSDPPFDGLNLGALTDDSVEAVVENRRRLATALGFAPERIAFAHQVHGADLMVAGESSSWPFASADAASAQRDRLGPQIFHLHTVSSDVPVAVADGHVISEPGAAALVFVADCVPVALAGPGGVAMLHCGWRGLAAGIVAKGVAAVGATDAAVGPSIGPCCYEVGDEVLAAFESLGADVANGRMLDLPEVTRRLLRQEGVERVELSGLCTSCETEHFYSHRRDNGRTGRQAGLAWLDGTGEG
ncbi:MAG TPA: polyphenol oxidase family protein [Solirubrobacterales bacterium]|nr:polyphenol oxidase family protein [Solirubrobacterales bacterium]